MRVYNNSNYISNGFIAASKKRFNVLQVPHSHDFFEIEFILEGTGIYEVDGVDYPIKKNTLFLLTPANIHSLRNVDAILMNVMFKSDFKNDFSDLAQLYQSYSPAFFLNDEDGDFLNSLLSEIVSVHEKDCQYAMNLLCCILHKLTLCYQPVSMPYLSYTQHAILYMLENFQTGVTLEMVATRLGLSKTYLSNLFFEQTGIGFKAYLDNIRFTYAQSLLNSTSLSINEVCESAGFNDYANFARRFKMRYHCSPSKFRKREELKPSE